MAYFSMQPFGDDLVDHQFAQLEALMANIHRDPKRSRKFDPDDFVLRRVPDPEPEEELTPGEIYQRFKRSLGL